MRGKPNLKESSPPPTSPHTTSPPPKRQKPSPRSPPTDETTIYSLIDTLTYTPVYTGKTVDTDRRLKQHASDSSSCRLVRQFVRKHGRSRIAIRPLVRCSAADADTNESFYIVKNNTLYPNGLNLRHGSMAGTESDECTSMVPVTPSVSDTQAATMMVVHAKTIESVDRDMLSTSAAWADVAAICAILDGDESESESESNAHAPLSIKCECSW